MDTFEPEWKTAALKLSDKIASGRVRIFENSVLPHETFTRHKEKHVRVDTEIHGASAINFSHSYPHRGYNRHSY